MRQAVFLHFLIVNETAGGRLARQDPHDAENLRFFRGPQQADGDLFPIDKLFDQERLAVSPLVIADERGQFFG